MLEVTKPLSVKLQSKSQDIHHAMEDVLDAVNVLQQLRYDGPAYDRIIQRAQETHGSEIAMPRMTGRQVHRVTTPEVIPGSTIGGQRSYHLSTFVSSSCVIDSRLIMQIHTTSRLLLPVTVMRQKWLPSKKLLDCTTNSCLKVWIAWRQSSCAGRRIGHAIQRIGVRNGYWKPYPTPQY